MNEFINKQAAIQSIKELFSMGDCYCDKYAIIGTLNSLPSIKKQAKVISHNSTIEFYKGRVKASVHEYFCENCKKKVLDGDNYCSHCGVELRWDE